MLSIIHWQNLSPSLQKNQLKRPCLDENINNSIKTIISVIRAKGDEALKYYTQSFDGIQLKDIKVAEETIMRATIDKKREDAIKKAIDVIARFHETLLPNPQIFDASPGIQLERVYRPIERVGFYLPENGNRPLISSLLMQAIPALVAHCPLRILCTPLNFSHQIDAQILVAARLCKINTIYSAGGAEAIAAMAYGTETIPKVDKIFGPGNVIVSTAKTIISQDPEGAAVDLPMGASELIILADDKANPHLIASDLLAEADESVDSKVFLICESTNFANVVNEALIEQFRKLSRTKIILQALEKSNIIVSTKLKDSIDMINQYAPENLQISCENPLPIVKQIQSAGTIFIGPFASKSMNYLSGANHILPTNGLARNHSGLSVFDFLKMITIQRITKEAYQKNGEVVKILSEIEGLEGQTTAINKRMELIFSLK